MAKYTFRKLVELNCLSNISGVSGICNSCSGRRPFCLTLVAKLGHSVKICSAWEQVVGCSRVPHRRHVSAWTLLGKRRVIRRVHQRANISRSMLSCIASINGQGSARWPSSPNSNLGFRTLSLHFCNLRLSRQI